MEYLFAALASSAVYTQGEISLGDNLLVDTCASFRHRTMGASLNSGDDRLSDQPVDGEATDPQPEGSGDVSEYKAGGAGGADKEVQALSSRRPCTGSSSGADVADNAAKTFPRCDGALALSVKFVKVANRVYVISDEALSVYEE